MTHVAREIIAIPTAYLRPIPSSNREPFLVVTTNPRQFPRHNSICSSCPKAASPPVSLTPASAVAVSFLSRLPHRPHGSWLATGRLLTLLLQQYLWSIPGYTLSSQNKLSVTAHRSTYPIRPSVTTDDGVDSRCSVGSYGSHHTRRYVLPLFAPCPNTDGFSCRRGLSRIRDGHFRDRVFRSHRYPANRLHRSLTRLSPSSASRRDLNEMIRRRKKLQRSGSTPCSTSSQSLLLSVPPLHSSSLLRCDIALPSPPARCALYSCSTE